jgi:hypothetical protein
MTSPTYHDVQQGTDEWLALRCGLLTASEIRLIMTPGTNKPADNDKSRAHLHELLAQRVTRHVEPHYISDDMLRGHEDEVRAKALYAQHYAPIREVGFVTRQFDNGRGGSFTLGYSPDGLVDSPHDKPGLVESKSRRQKYQVQTVLGIARGQAAPDEYMLQIQTGMLVTGREWCDFISYSGGLPMAVSRVFADHAMQERILAAAKSFELRLDDEMRLYLGTCEKHRWVETERPTESEDGGYKWDLEAD